ncbi:sodium-dependent phosphate transport protein 2B-like [Arapaima gigas]
MTDLPCTSVLQVQSAVPLIMGTNTGTSATNTIMAITQVGARSTAFTSATLQDFFKWLSVLMLLPLELFFSYLYRLTKLMVDHLHMEPDEEAPELLSIITKPIIQLEVLHVLLTEVPESPNRTPQTRKEVVTPHPQMANRLHCSSSQSQIVLRCSEKLYVHSVITPLVGGLQCDQRREDFPPVSGLQHWHNDHNYTGCPDRSRSLTQQHSADFLPSWTCSLQPWGHLIIKTTSQSCCTSFQSITPEDEEKAGHRREEEVQTTGFVLSVMLRPVTTADLTCAKPGTAKSTHL